MALPTHFIALMVILTLVFSREARATTSCDRSVIFYWNKDVRAVGQEKSEDNLGVSETTCKRTETDKAKSSLFDAVYNSCKKCTTNAQIKKDTLAMIKYVGTHPNAAKCACRAAFTRVDSLDGIVRHAGHCVLWYRLMPSLLVSNSPLITGRDFAQIRSSPIAARRVSDNTQECISKISPYIPVSQSIIVGVGEKDL